MHLVSGEGATRLAVFRGNLAVFALLAASFTGEVLVLASITLVAVTTIRGGDELAVHASRADSAVGGAVSRLLAVLADRADKPRLFAVLTSNGTLLRSSGTDSALVTSGATLAGLEFAGRAVVAREGACLRLVATGRAVKAGSVLFGSEPTDVTFVTLAVTSQLRASLGSVTKSTLLAGITFLASLGTFPGGIAAGRARVARVQTLLGLEHTTWAIPALGLAYLALPLAGRARSADDATLVNELTLRAVERFVASSVLGIFVTVIAPVTDGSCRTFHAIVASLVRSPIVSIGLA